MVMATFWTSPTRISQYCETGAELVHISWNNLDIEKISSTNKISIGTNGSLYHIARSPKHDSLTKTYFMKLTGFNFQNLPVSVSGIEMRLNSNRRGRIVDDTIQLIYNNEYIGDNKAIAEIKPIHIYGSSTDHWNTSISISDVQDINFGIVLRFKSHPKWPHNDPMFIDSVELRIH